MIILGEKNVGNKFKDNRAMKSGIFYLIAEILTRGISFLVTPIFTRILPSSVFADAKVYESWAYLIAPVVSLSLYQSIARAKYDFHKEYDRYLSSILFLMTAVTGCVFIICLFVPTYIEKILGFDRNLLFLLLMYCLAYNGIQSVQLYDRQLLNYRRNVVLTLLGVVPGVIISLLLVLYYKGSVTNDVLFTMRIVGYFAPTALIGISLIVYIFLKYRTLINKEYWKYGVLNSLPLMTTAVATQVFFQTGNIFVRRMIGADEAAIVVVALTMGYIMDILIHALDNAWKPWLFEQLSKSEFDKVKEFWKLLLITIAVLIIGLTLYAPEIIFFIGGIQYADAIQLIGSVLCSSLVNFIMIGYISLEQYFKKTNISGCASIISAIYHLIINYILIKYLGYQSVGYALCSVYIFACIIHCLMMHKFLKSDILQVRFSVILTFITFIICMSSSAFYHLSFWSRSCIIIIIFLGSIWMTRKQILKWINIL